MQIAEISDKKIWEDFLSGVKPHTFLQSWNWGEFNQAIANKIWRLGFYNNNNLIGIALVVKVIARRGSFLFCPHGPVIADKHADSNADHTPIIKSFSDYLKVIAQSEGCAFFRISPLLPASTENNQIFTQLGYRESPAHMMHPELAWILDITPPETKLLADMRKTTRYSIKKAYEAGVKVYMSANLYDLHAFHKLYTETVARQQFTPFSFEYLTKEFETFNKSNEVRLFFAFYHNTPVATAFIIFTGDSAFYHHGASSRAHDKIPAAQLLQWHVIQEAKRRGLHYYNFWGVVPETAVKHPWHGLSLFKRGFGGFEEAYAHAKDFVISPKYWLNFVVEKIRRIKRRL